MLKKLVKKTPVVRDIARALLSMSAKARQGSFDSAKYWEERYRTGGNSGPGSYSRLAEFKAQVLNDFVKDHAVDSVIEFGCGDGAQLAMAEYPHYTGVDVSPTILAQAREKFAGDPTKAFLLLEDADDVGADLSMSLDVIFHLVEDAVFEAHMAKVFGSAGRYAVVFSSNENKPTDAVHVKHRKFSDWVDKNAPQFELIKHVTNPYPYDVADMDNTSFADFYFYKKK